MEEALYRKHPRLYDVFYSDVFFRGESGFVAERTPEGGSVLVVGCGTGEHSKILEEKGFSVTGVDKNPEILELARTKSEADFVQDSLPDLEIEGKFDTVWVPHQPIHYIEKDEVGEALESLGDLLKDDGTLIFDMFDFEDRGPVMEIHETDEGEYARIVQVNELEDDKFSFESLIFLKEDKSEFFMDSHDLTNFSQDFMDEELESSGFKFEKYPGYTEQEREEPVYVAKIK